MTAEYCRAKAAEAEALAKLISFGPDKAKLLTSAAEWLVRAEAACAGRALATRRL